RCFDLRNIQYKCALQEILMKNHQKVIVIILGNISNNQLDPDLRLCFKSNTVIHSSDELFWHKFRLAMPEPTLTKQVVHTYCTISERTPSSANKYSVTPS
ncbi:unnamed protein product, partial [Meganyctiphanes norvegica]